MSIATCIGCGCDDYNACEDNEAGGPCCWLVVDYAEGRGVCSACPEHVGRWNKGDHEIAVPTDEMSGDVEIDLPCLLEDLSVAGRSISCSLDELEMYERSPISSAEISAKEFAAKHCQSVQDIDELLVGAERALSSDYGLEKDEVAFAVQTLRKCLNGFQGWKDLST